MNQALRMRQTVRGVQQRTSAVLLWPYRARIGHADLGPSSATNLLPLTLDQQAFIHFMKLFFVGRPVLSFQISVSSLTFLLTRVHGPLFF